MSQTYTLFRAAAPRTDTLAMTLATARDRYQERQTRAATEARVNTAEAEGLGVIAGLVIVPDVRVHFGEVWLTDDSRVL